MEHSSVRVYISCRGSEKSVETWVGSSADPLTRATVAVLVVRLVAVRLISLFDSAQRRWRMRLAICVPSTLLPFYFGLVISTLQHVAVVLSRLVTLDMRDVASCSSRVVIVSVWVRVV